MEMEQSEIPGNDIEEVVVDDELERAETKLEQIWSDGTCRYLKISFSLRSSVAHSTEGMDLAHLLKDTLQLPSIERLLLLTPTPRDTFGLSRRFLETVASGIAASKSIRDLTLSSAFDLFSYTLGPINDCTSIQNAALVWTPGVPPPSGPIMSVVRLIRKNQLKTLKLSARFQACIPILKACKENTSIEHFEFIDGNSVSRRIEREQLGPWAEQNRKLRLAREEKDILTCTGLTTDRTERLCQLLIDVQERPFTMTYEYLRTNIDLVSSLSKDHGGETGAAKNRSNQTKLFRKRKR